MEVYRKQKKKERNEMKEKKMVATPKLMELQPYKTGKGKLSLESDFQA